MLRTDVFCIGKKVCNRPGCAIDPWDTLISKKSLVIVKLIKIIITFNIIIKNSALKIKV